MDENDFRSLSAVDAQRGCFCIVPSRLNDTTSLFYEWRKSYACSLSERDKVHGGPYASDRCIGNLAIILKADFHETNCSAKSPRT